MAKITQVTVGLTDSVKVADYKYVKPHISMTAVLDDGDTLEDVLEELRVEVNLRMQEAKEEIGINYEEG